MIGVEGGERREMILLRVRVCVRVCIEECSLHFCFIDAVNEERRSRIRIGIGEMIS